MTVITPTAIVEVELDGVDAGWTDVTADVLRAPGIVIRRGIDETRPDARVASTGTASFALNNSENNSTATVGYYSPHHANVRRRLRARHRLPGVACRTRRPGMFAVQFLGRLDAIDPLPGAHGARQVLVTAVDWFDEAARWRLTPAIGEQIDKSWDAVLDRHRRADARPAARDESSTAGPRRGRMRSTPARSRNRPRSRSSSSSPTASTG